MIHLLPGFALDRRVIERLGLPPDRFRCADFIPVEKGETLARYAVRMAESIGFKPGEAVGGVSMGGMLALEIARQCGARKILLLAGCTHPRFVRWGFRATSPLAPLAPEAFIGLVFRNFPALMGRLGMHTAEGEAFLRDVMGKFPPSLLRHLPRLIMEWPGCEPTAPCRALHSERDWLIRPPLHLSGLSLVPGKSHLLTLSAPDLSRRFFLEAEE